jgi:hypothetical protein
MQKFYTRAPKDCDPEELAAFAKLVSEGGEVAAGGLSDHIRGAVALAFLAVDAELAGVGGLKRPRSSYRAKVARSSGVDLPEERYPFELGWVYVKPGVRGGKSRMLSEALLPHAGGQGVFASSRTNNPWMHATLLALGFERVGSEWASGENPADLALFVRKPSI